MFGPVTDVIVTTRLETRTPPTPLPPLPAFVFEKLTSIGSARAARAERGADGATDRVRHTGVGGLRGGAGRRGRRGGAWRRVSASRPSRPAASRSRSLPDRGRSGQTAWAWYSGRRCSELASAAPAYRLTWTATVVTRTPTRTRSTTSGLLFPACALDPPEHCPPLLLPPWVVGASWLPRARVRRWKGDRGRPSTGVVAS